MNNVLTTSTKNTSLIPAALIVAVGLIISASILKTEFWSNLFFVPPGPGYQKVSAQFKQQMEAGMIGQTFGGEQSWDGVQIRGVTFERKTKSYHVKYAVILNLIKKNRDIYLENDCPLSPNGSNGYQGLCNRLYSSETEKGKSYPYKRIVVR